MPESSWSPAHGPRGPPGTAQAGVGPRPADVVAFVSLLWEPIKPSEPCGGSGGEGRVHRGAARGPESHGDWEHTTTGVVRTGTGRPLGIQGAHPRAPGALIATIQERPAGSLPLPCLGHSLVPASLYVSARLFLLPVASSPSFLTTVQLPPAT